MRKHLLHLSLPALLALAAPLPGCGSCNDGPGMLRAGGTAPSTPVDVARALGERIPGTVPAAVLVDDWTALATAWVGIRPRLDDLLGNVGMMENDLRNTLGFDPARPDSLREIGINPAGGLLVLSWHTTPVVALDLIDDAAFLARATTVLQNQPFRLRGNVRERTEGAWSIHEFRRSDDGPVQVEVMLRDGTALLVLAPRALEDAPETLAQAFDATTSETSLAAQTGFDTMLRTAESFPIVGFLHYAPIAEDVMRSAGDDLALLHVAERLRDAGTLSFGVRPAGDAFTFTMAWTPTGTLSESIDTLFANSTTPSEFAPFVADNTFFLARSSVDPAALLRLARAWVPPAQQEPIDTAFQTLRETRGVDIEGDIIGSLGGNGMVLATRVRPLTLRRVLESRNPAPGEISSAFGLMAAFDVTDRERLLRAIDTIVPSLEGTLTRFDDNGATILQFTDGRFDVGNVVLVDDLLLVVPERERAAVLARIRAGGTEVAAIRDDGARTLVTDSHVQGAHLDIRALLDGPVGAALRPMMPAQASRALDTLDLVTFDVRREGPQLRANGTLRFTPVVVEAAAPAE